MPFACRAGCGACCIAPSITTPMPDMPGGKAAGVRCRHLDADNLCRLFDAPERPAFCAGLRPSPEMCGRNAGDALRYLTTLETLTQPASGLAR